MFFSLSFGVTRVSEDLLKPTTTAVVSIATSVSRHEGMSHKDESCNFQLLHFLYIYEPKVFVPVLHEWYTRFCRRFGWV